MFENVKKIVNQLNKLTNNFVPEIGIILGSGWSEVVSILENPIVINYSKIKGMPETTVAGHKGNFVFGKLHNKNVVFVQGRFHLFEGHDPKTVVLPVLVLHALGTKKLILTNAAGAVNENYKVGDVVVINDFINFTGRSPLIGLTPTEEKPVFVDLSSPLNKKMSEIAYKVVEKNLKTANYGTYFQVLGPTYETPADIKMIRTLGGDVVGMSTILEIIMANYEKLDVCALSFVSNMGTGIEKVKLSHLEVLEESNKKKKVLSQILSDIIKKI